MSREEKPWEGILFFGKWTIVKYPLIGRNEELDGLS
jgi:hypothetical protein